MREEKSEKCFVYALWIFAGHFFMKGLTVMKTSTKKLTSAAMLCAAAYILMFISKIIPAVSGFLQFDAKDVVISIGGFLLGPMYAVLISLVVVFLEFISIGSTGFIGLIMNFISTASFCVTAALIYRYKKTIFGAVWGLVAGTLALTALMLLWNYYITPIYMEIPRSVVASMIPTVFLPFNLVKGFINSGLILIVYRPVVETLRRAGLVESGSGSPKKKMSVSLVIGAVLLAVFIPVLLSMAGII